MTASRGETSSPPSPAFAGMVLDRASSLRGDPDWVAQQLEDPASRAVASGRDGVVIDDAAQPRLLRRLLDLDRVAPDGPILLGLEDSVAIFAVDFDSLETAARERWQHRGRVVALREAGSLLSRAEGGLAAYLAGLLNWHRSHRFCANCGAATVVIEAGYSRRCPSCGVVHFPRTDPVVIMLVEQAGHLLLGRRPGWPEGQYSVLAGFVSPGESLEEAVIREVREESGIEVCDPAFVTSQPWPFPSSLMLGFEAGSAGGEPRALDGELEDVRWFSRDAVVAAQAGAPGELRLPPSISIAHFLIERWAGRAG
ncbi:MAG: NAD(+) diphosphatase [Actinomycetota bacterium]|nr:NAD(+) diphosphatase [Actinomycetota bacterium]